MKRKVIITKDGSTTLEVEGWQEHYHSTHGAIQEAYYVFIDKGLSHINKPKTSILEIGFGTGLNAFITFLETTKQDLSVHYEGIEAYPITMEEASAMNYSELLKVQSYKHIFEKMHKSPWEENITISDRFSLKKRQQFFDTIKDQVRFDLIYFDAFGARVQPELWTESIFKRMYEALVPNGVLVTYASKGSARRAMIDVGFSVEKLAGPIGKREMLRATKII